MPDTFSKDLSISIVGAAEDVSVGAASTQSTAAPQGARFARLCATVDCRFASGSSNPTALATSTLLPAGTVEYLAVNPGWEVAVIQVSSAGLLNISWCE
jgi:hypothetical protein